MVITGSPDGNGIKVETVDLLDPTKSCVLGDIPLRRDGAGGIIGTTPVICGGYYWDTNLNTNNYLNDCLLYGTSQKIIMNSERYMPFSVAINPNKIWILGGDTTANSASSEFITLNGAENGPTLPEAVSGACAVEFPETGDIYLIGGHTYSSSGSTNGYTRNVWVTNPSNGYTFSQGPSLMTSRCDLGCAAMSIGAKSIIVAAGGYNVPAVGHSADYPLPIEILDPQLNQWVAGKCMLNL